MMVFCISEEQRVLDGKALPGQDDGAAKSEEKCAVFVDL